MLFLSIRDCCAIDYLNDHTAPRNPEPNENSHGLLLGVSLAPSGLDEDGAWLQVFINLIDEFEALIDDTFPEEKHREMGWNNEFGENTDLLLAYVRSIEPWEVVPVNAAEWETDENECLIWFELTWS